MGGGALSIYVDGEPVLDLWAGQARKGQEWRRDTAPVIFSASKGATATIVHRLVDRGLLDYGAPVSLARPPDAQRHRDVSRLQLPPGRKQLIVGDFYHSNPGLGFGRLSAPPRVDVLQRAWFDR